jgi:hypothetical protein
MDLVTKFVIGFGIFCIAVCILGLTFVRIMDWLIKRDKMNAVPTC